MRFTVKRINEEDNISASPQELMREKAANDYKTQIRQKGYDTSVSKEDISLPRERISLALQGYNFGSGYISWAMRNYGGYSELNAMEFSEIMAQRMGWQSYGNPQYVQHVMKWYMQSDPSTEIK